LAANLKATYDFAKKAAHVAMKTFPCPVASNEQERKLGVPRRSVVDASAVQQSQVVLDSGEEQ